MRRSGLLWDLLVSLGLTESHAIGDTKEERVIDAIVRARGQGAELYRRRVLEEYVLYRLNGGTRV